MTTILESTPLDSTAHADTELELCANPDCGRPYAWHEGFDGLCDPCAARQCDHLGGEHAADPDPECRFCT